MVMSKITDEDKKLFFDDIHPIQGQYNIMVRYKSFEEAEAYKENAIKHYILSVRDKLLKLRDKVNGS